MLARAARAGTSHHRHGRIRVRQSGGSPLTCGNGHNGGIARGAVPTKHLLALGLFLGVLVGLALYSDLGRDGERPAPVTSTHPGAFAPAGRDSVCSLLPHSEAEALVGHEIPNPAVEPLRGQCAWPDEPGNVVGELYFVVKERERQDLGTVLRREWDAARFRIEPVEGLGDEAYFVIRLADRGEATGEFVTSLDVHVRDLHLVLGNGGRASWEGSQEAIRERLRVAMRRILERVEKRLGGT